MTSCTIIISHYESLPFLECCLRQINKHRNKNVKHNVIIVDQSRTTQFIFNPSWFDVEDIVSMVHTFPLYSGFGLDWVFRHLNITSEYICQLHVDAFPIHKNWLYLPIKLIEENNFSFVGQHQFTCDGTQSIYPPDPFFSMSQCFNVARTETYKEMSMEAGFTRFHNRPQSGLTFKNEDWAQWASHDYNSRGSDDDVVAFHWEDKYRRHDKFGLAISGMINTAEQGGSFGRIIENLVFHFSSGRESIGVMDLMPQKYQDYYKRIQKGFTDELLEEMLSQVKTNNHDRTLWDGKEKMTIPVPEELNKRIEELKNEK